jgi:O-antigen/teichoic acid export membrane protein
VGLTGESLAAEPASAVTSLLAARAVANRIVRASAVYGSANFGIRALNFLLLPIYTRYLTPSDYGMIALAETLAMFLMQVVNLGFDASIQRLYFQHVDDSSELSGYIGSALKFALGTEVGFLLLALTAGPWLQRMIWPHAAVPFRYIALAMVTAAATQFFTYRLVLYQAERRPRIYAVLSFLSFGLTASLSVSLVAAAHRGVMGMLGGKCLAAMICLSIAVFLASPSFRSPFHWHHVRETASLGLPLVPHQLMAGGLIAADRFILLHYRDLREVGLYSIAYTFGMVMALITTSLNQAWAPVYYDIARKGEEGRQLLSKMCSGIIIVLVTIACFGALCAQDFIARFLDAKYAAAGRVVPWIIGAYLAHSLFSMFSLAALQARRTKVIMGASFVALVLNTILNFALIPRWGMYGAAYATLLAYVAEALVMYSLAQRICRLHYDLPRAFAAMGVLAAVLVITQIRWSAPIRPVVMGGALVVSVGLLLALGFGRSTRYLRLIVRMPD